MKVYRTACPRDCTDCCSLLAYVDENGRLAGVKGDPDHPVTRGYLCPKGNSYVELVYHPKRLLYPLMKKNGEFRRVTWDEALDFIAKRLTEVVDTYGPLAVLHYHYSGSEVATKHLDTRFFNALDGITKVSGDLCFSGGLAAQIYDFGGLMQNSIEDLPNARGCVLWGRNVKSTNAHSLPFIKECRRRGGKIAVVNPLPTGMEGIAELVVRPKPGTDAALALGACRYLVERGEIDREFIDKYTYGFDEFRKALEDYPLERVSEITGVGVDDIVRLALFYAENTPVTTLLGFGLQRYRGGGNAVRAVDALAAVTGNIGKPGAGVSYCSDTYWHVGSHVKGAAPAGAGRTIYMWDLARGILNAQDPPVKMAFITNANPVVNVPDTAMMRKALNSIDTVVAIDVFMTDTAKEADVVLPCTTFFEEENVKVSSWSPWIYYCPKVIEPVGDARPDEEIFIELARRIGLKDFPWESREQFLEYAAEAFGKFGVDLSLLRKKGHIKNPFVPEVAWQDKKFRTPSGKFEFYSQKALAEGQSPTAAYVAPACEDDRYPYHFITPHSRYRIHSQFQVTQYIKKLNPFPKVYINSEEGIRLGLKEGQEVEVYNDTGSIRTRVYFDPMMRKDTLSLESGWSVESGACPNFLVPSRATEMGACAALYDVKVGIRAVDRSV
ncbi:molybdopterin-containing oxidoreductase family protein [Thermosediminibacter litoriperuensis]|uniref:Anaerobic selenocysteine-containing dehydrogenase n=1 Tax=Thermosediminibacter litoriperuensis TaxID=291989 RepID=A0A5S5AVU1_9FIRM|nr:molybdopterin-dependent oxidoreductase [Thermosediminibacter litoriperuensis]TYP57461.1 anaerobic selenocysteine-containing dehydrogenase [Thermosediminibacter litoriperuensis]